MSGHRAVGPEAALPLGMYRIALAVTLGGCLIAAPATTFAEQPPPTPGYGALAAPGIAVADALIVGMTINLAIRRDSLAIAGAGAAAWILTAPAIHGLGYENWKRAGRSAALRLGAVAAASALSYGMLKLAFSDGCTDTCAVLTGLGFWVGGTALLLTPSILDGLFIRDAREEARLARRPTAVVTLDGIGLAPHRGGASLGLRGRF